MTIYGIPHCRYEVEMVKIDCSNLINEMKKRGITFHEIAFLLGKEDSAITAKAEGKTDWMYEEAVAVRNALFPDCELEYLFRQKNTHEA